MATRVVNNPVGKAMQASWARRLQWLTLGVAGIAVLVLMLWPQPLMPEGGGSVDHLRVSLIFGGLCLGLVVGCGFLQQLPLWQWSIAMLLSWLAVVSVVISLW